MKEEKIWCKWAKRKVRVSECSLMDCDWCLPEEWKE
jgi:hypothetical protein